MTYNCPQCGLPRTGNQAMGLAMPQCLCSWQFSPPTPSAPKREWVGLTEEDVEKLIDDAGFTRTDLLMIGDCVSQIIDEVEAKLKEKNHG